MPFEICRNNIVHMKMDAIVNTANPLPLIGGGTDSAIHEKAGPELLKAREKIGPIVPGCSAITPAFGLDARYVIHSVGPVWEGGDHQEAEILRKSYDSALALALEHGCRSLAFPLMGAGTYGFPKERALSVAVAAITDFLMGHEMDIYLVVFSREAFGLSQQLRADVQSYVDEHYVDQQLKLEYHSRFRDARPLSRNRSVRRETVTEQETAEPAADLRYSISPVPGKEASIEILRDSLAQRLQQRSETFTEALRRIIDEHGWTDSEVYNRVYMDRKTFNKIINNKNHKPSKQSALLLAVALRLNLDQTKDLLAKAGYALNPSSKFDVVLSFFLDQGEYNIMTIDEVLFELTEETLSKCG